MEEKANAKSSKKSDSGVVVKGIGDVSVRFSRCCNPVPGDEIIGFVTRGRGVSIHRTDCSNIIICRRRTDTGSLTPSGRSQERTERLHPFRSRPRSDSSAWTEII